MSHCARLNCPHKPTHECICRDERKYFCETDLLSHIKDKSLNHNVKEIDYSSDSKVQEYVISILNNIKSDLIKNKKLILEDFSRSITLLEEKGRVIIRSINDYEKNIDKAINDIKSNSSQLPECNLKRILNASLEEVKKESNDWNLISVKLNFIEFKNSINDWCVIGSNLDYFYTNRKIIADTNYPKNEHRKESLKIDPSPDKSNLLNEPSTPRVQPLNKNSGKKIERSNTTDFQKKTLRCEKNHELKWSTTIPFNYYKKSKNFWIGCDNCGMAYSKSGWNCQDCSYDLCEGCGLNLGGGCPKLKCTNNHELLWRPDANLYYQKKNQGHSSMCKKCGMVKDEAHWNCRDCNYDVCQKCGLEEGYTPMVGKVKCKNDHPLQEKFSQGTVSCQCCKDNFKGKLYYCQSCKYILCIHCFNFFNNPPAGHPVLRCSSAHLLRWGPSKRFQCNSCYTNKNEESYRCIECDFDLCLECSDVLLKLIIKNPSKSHSPNHPLVYRPKNDSNPVQCELCGVNYSSMGMFGCKSCPSYYCILCYDNPQRPKPGRPSSVDPNDLLAQLLLANMKRNQ